MFDAPLDEQPSWNALHEVLRDRGLELPLRPPRGGARTGRAIIVRPDCADLPYFLRAYFAFQAGPSVRRGRGARAATTACRPPAATSPRAATRSPSPTRTSRQGRDAHAAVFRASPRGPILRGRRVPGSRTCGASGSSSGPRWPTRCNRGPDAHRPRTRPATTTRSPSRRMTLAARHHLRGSLRPRARRRQARRRRPPRRGASCSPSTGSPTGRWLASASGGETSSSRWTPRSAARASSASAPSSETG